MGVTIKTPRRPLPFTCRIDRKSYQPYFGNLFLFVEEPDFNVGNHGGLHFGPCSIGVYIGRWEITTVKTYAVIPSAHGKGGDAQAVGRAGIRWSWRRVGNP